MSEVLLAQREEGSAETLDSLQYIQLRECLSTVYIAIIVWIFASGQYCIFRFHRLVPKDAFSVHSWTKDVSRAAMFLSNQMNPYLDLLKASREARKSLALVRT